MVVMNVPWITGDGVDDDLDDDVIEAPSCTGNTKGSWFQPSPFEFEKEDADKDRELRCFSKFPGFCGCYWIDGKVYPFGAKDARDVLPGGPTALMLDQAYVGSENMKSTYRLLCRFRSGDRTSAMVASAVALSPHTMVTSGRNLRYVVDGVEWKLAEVLVLAGEYVPLPKLAKFGYRCKVLCRELGSSIEHGFLSVSETLPSWLLPCSPSTGMLLSSFGFPDAVSFLRAAVEELRDDQSFMHGPVWNQYKAAMRGEIQDLAAELGDFRAAEIGARKLLLEHFVAALGEMPEGVEACSAGRVEELTDAFVTHSCPSLPGSPGAAVCSLRRPGYLVGCLEAGPASSNMNLATSVDNRAFVTGYLRYVLRELPPRTSPVWSRPFFTIAPFLEWVRKLVSGSGPVLVMAATDLRSGFQLAKFFDCHFLLRDEFLSQFKNQQFLWLYATREYPFQDWPSRAPPFPRYKT